MKSLIKYTVLFSLVFVLGIFAQKKERENIVKEPDVYNTINSYPVNERIKSNNSSGAKSINGTPIEIAYDSTEPQGVYVLSVGDTMAVSFDGLSGTKLDSIKVALRNTASVEGGVWRAGTTTFLDQRLAGPFNVSGKTTPAVVNPSGPYPYEQPYKNWVSIDLRSQNIDASKNFVVGFIVNGIYQNSSSPYNRVMFTKIPGTSAFHSYTYLTKPISGSPGWYYIGDGTNISLYLIRAYVSYVSPTAVNEPIELLPSNYSLEQNYPNPFNPATVISYQLPVTGYVTLKVYDLLGSEVRTLVNEEKSAGEYEVEFDASKLSSGVYFYKLESGSFVSVKKMILVK